MRKGDLRVALTNNSYEAEKEGFEPSVAHDATPVFETGPINHSGTSPMGGIIA